MTELATKHEQTKQQPKVVILKPKEFETPQAELENEPEYKHLVKLCAELGLEI